MARLGNRVLLGFEDEPITEKYKDYVNFTTNKVGGKPDWPGDAPTAVTCKLCSLNLPLVLQIYAPLDNSLYHRTLYLFACINPNCWNQNGSWVCLRSQVLDAKSDLCSNAPATIVPQDASEWCSGVDDWSDEENGNIIDGTLDSSNADDLARGMSEMEISVADEKNANSCGSGEGAIGTIPMATAIIEGEESEVVCIDSPTTPRINLIAVMEETAPLPQVPVSRLEFAPHFVGVSEEELYFAPPPSPTENELAKKFQYDEEATGEEKYEKSLPAHGDKMFYQFVTKLQANPGQILRYGGHPLYLYPVSGRPRSCRSCGGDLMFELQVLPTLIPKLRLPPSTETHLEFGSVFLFSCRSSCWSQQDSYKEEELVVQAERI